MTAGNNVQHNIVTKLQLTKHHYMIKVYKKCNNYMISNKCEEYFGRMVKIIPSEQLQHNPEYYKMSEA